jgi:DNA-binding NarL/FixJ family response regulator
MTITVLLVDDSEEFLAAAAAFLDAEPGVEVLGSARSGSEAIATVQRLHPDLVLMDVAMPGMDGITAAGVLRAERSRSRVVLLTLHDTLEYRTAAAKVADAFLPKDGLVSGLTPLIRRLFAPGPGCSAA